MTKRSIAAWTLGSILSGLPGSLHAAAPKIGPAQPAYLQSSTRLPAPRSIAQDDLTLSCFEGFLSILLNVGCFTTVNPSQPGDCRSTAGDFMVQYVFPDVAIPHRVVGFGFLSNDGSTIFPSAGVIQIPIVQGFARYPTPAELANLSAQMISSVIDTTVAFVDVQSEEIRVEPGANTALILALQFPTSGLLENTIGVGPGIAADGDYPDQTCDRFTIDGGATWFEPFPCTEGDPLCDPVDWGFVVLLEPIVGSVSQANWTQVKVLFRTP